MLSQNLQLTGNAENQHLPLFVTGLALATKQWGKYTDSNTNNRTVTINFPLAFSSGCYSIASTEIYRRDESDYQVCIKSMSTTSFSIAIDDWSKGFYYIAVGK